MCLRVVWNFFVASCSIYLVIIFMAIAKIVHYFRTFSFETSKYFFRFPIWGLKFYLFFSFDYKAFLIQANVILKLYFIF